MKQAVMTSALTLALLTGCVPTSNLGLSNGATAEENVGFRTNTTRFINRLAVQTTPQNRNEYLNEFLDSSNVQCQHYLNHAKEKPSELEQKTALYMNLFDSMSALFGMKYVTDTAKAALSDNPQDTKANQEAFDSALYPEIRRGVELARSRYAKRMKQKESLGVDKYSVSDLQYDIKQYDRQCDASVGLVEINKALREIQEQMRTRTVPTKAPLINPIAIKNKVKAVTKKVEEKELRKIENQVPKIAQEPQVPTVRQVPKPNLPVSSQVLEENQFQ